MQAAVSEHATPPQWDFLILSKYYLSLGEKTDVTGKNLIGKQSSCQED